MPQESIDNLYLHTRMRLVRTARRLFLTETSKLLVQLLFYFFFSFLLITVLELIFELSSAVRIGFWAGGAIFALVFVAKKILPNLRGIWAPGEAELEETAVRVGRAHPAVADSLLNFLQIYQDRGISCDPEIKTISLKQLYRKFDPVEFDSIVSYGPLGNVTRRLVVLGTVFIILFIIFPAAMNRAVLKMLYPANAFLEPLPVTLSNLTGNAVVLKNDPVELQGEFDGLTPHKIWLVIRTVDSNRDSVLEKLEIQPAGGNKFSYTINHVQNPFAYWFEATIDLSKFASRPALSAVGYVEVKERPFIRNLQIKLQYPRYTGFPEQLLAPNDGEISAVKGSIAHIEVEANKKIQQARVVFQHAAQIELKTVENRASGQITILQDDRYQIAILDADSIPNYQPVEYSIVVIPDESPFVEIVNPGRDLDLTEDMKVPLTVNLSDDYGFSGLVLRGRLIRAGSTGDTSEFRLKLPIRYLEKTKGISEILWELSSFFMVPDDYVEYFAEVWDNDQVSGPKSARSKVYVLRLPSLIDILEETDTQISENLEDTEKMVKESRELRKKLEEINREMKREKQLSWERKKEVEEQMTRQKDFLKKLEDIRTKLEENIQKLDDQNLISPETLEKYLELQKMLQEIATPELQKLMEKLQEALEKANLPEVKKALEEFKFSAEQFEQNIERTYELFKQVQLEQKMDELVQMAEKMLKEQQRINRELENPDASSEKLKQLQNQEGHLEKQMDFFEEKLENTRDLYQETTGENSEDLQNLEKFLEAEQISQEMQQMQQQVGQGKLRQAKSQGKKLSTQLGNLHNLTSQAKENMLREQKQQLLQAMQKVVDEMLKTSFEQEKLIEQSQKTDMASPRIPEIARKQAQLRENSIQIIKQMMSISKKTFFVSPQMNQTMASLMKNIQKSLEQLEERNPASASRAQTRAMANLNQAVLSMQSSMQQLSQAGSASGFEEFMEQLQQMAGQQGQLNQQSMGLFQQQGQGRMKLSEDALARLAAQQEMIRQSLEKLNQQMGSRGDVLGRLNELGQEMEKVIDELKRNKLDRKVIQRQERILSRLLDAQKSIREKEYSRKRKAEHERNVLVKSPPQLQKEFLERENILEKELLESLQEGYSLEYQNYIKQYFETLSRKTQTPP